jgi:hypothetical protein
VNLEEVYKSIVSSSIRYKLKYKYLLADSWYCNANNINYLNTKDKLFIFGIATNRKKNIINH